MIRDLLAVDMRTAFRDLNPYSGFPLAALFCYSAFSSPKLRYDMSYDWLLVIPDPDLQPPVVNTVSTPRFRITE